MLNTEEIVDISRHFPKAEQAERKGRNALIMHHLDSPRKRFDGTMAEYELDYRWLSRDNDDEAACVQGNEITLWTAKEYDPNKGLFDQFNLF